MSEHDPLIDFVTSVSGDGYLKVEESLGDGYVRLRVPEAERRQAKHDIQSVEDIVVELLRNARDAHAQRIFVATTREGSTRTLTMIDDGVGIPPALQDTVFEPRVTSKLETMVMDRWGVHGRGMALYSVRSNVVSARVACSSPHKGASISVITDSERLTERADQSTWPTVEPDESGRLHVGRGPHNIIRRLVEFACEHPELEIYLGTPTEVLATLHTLGRMQLDIADLMFCEDLERLVVWQRPAACSDAAELTAIADTIGLTVSERTAHRVLAGELAPLEPILATLAVADEPEKSSAPDIYRDRRSLRLHHDDLVAFRAELTRAFDVIAERYYVSLRGEPRITVGRDSVNVRFPIEKED
ncbi:MAG TPA: ATP-binding protein [Coriobacteriia bacterium]|nr:MAG: ATP-binding region ATPase domain protein [Actinobacteria bacterium 66_15]HAL29265.1 ATP-binding protein [Coriobacteriia bacterium]